MNDQLGELWDRTKARPGYIANLLIQTMFLISVLDIMKTAFNNYPDSTAVVLVYGLVGIVTVNELSPRIGQMSKEFVNATADLYWSKKAGDQQ